MGFSYNFCNRKLCLCLLISFAYTFNIPLKFRNPYSFCRTINLEFKQSVADSEILEYEDTELLVKLYNKKILMKIHCTKNIYITCCLPVIFARNRELNTK